MHFESKLRERAKNALKGEGKEVFVLKMSQALNANADAFISSVQEIERLYSEFPKVLRIRIERWVEKLVNSGSNPAFTTHRNAYTKLLLSMVRSARFGEPFHRMPPDGRLAPFPAHLRSLLRNVEDPVPVSNETVVGGSDAGFWDDMRLRASGNTGDQIRRSYIHVAPVATTTAEVAREELERAHSNTINSAPAKKAISLSPVHSSRVHSSAPPSPPPPDAIYLHEQLQAFRPFARRYPSDMELNPSYSHVGNTSLHGMPVTRHLHGPAPSHTPIRSRHGAAEHTLDHSAQALPSAHMHAHASMLDTSRQSALNGESLQHLSRSHSHLSTQSTVAPLPVAAHQLPYRTPLGEFHVDELAVLHSMLHEQNVRIGVLEEQLIQERHQHARQLHDMQYAHAAELARLREFEVSINRIQSPHERRDSSIVHAQNASRISAQDLSSVRTSGNGLNATNMSHNQSAASGNLNIGRDYHSMEFDKAYGGIVSTSIGDWPIASGNRSVLQQSPERDLDTDKGISRNHRIHISSPPPRLPGRTSPIPMSNGHDEAKSSSSAAVGFPKVAFPDGQHSMLGRSFAAQSQRWVNDSLASSDRSGQVAAIRSASPPPPPLLQRESMDKEDMNFLSYLTAFQEELKRV